MKGAVNINTSPPTSRVNKSYRGSQPCLRWDERVEPALRTFGHSSQRDVVFRNWKAKRRVTVADHGSIWVSMDYCFSRSCEGG